MINLETQGVLISWPLCPNFFSTSYKRTLKLKMEVACGDKLNRIGCGEVTAARGGCGVAMVTASWVIAPFSVCAECR